MPSTPPRAFALPLLREAGLTLSTDLHNRDGVNTHHEPLAQAADLVLASTTALADPGRTMRRIVERGRARTVVASAAGDAVGRDELLARAAALDAADGGSP
ncbi:hypothetical protein ACFVVL_31060 [Kitasatospora sp. NPDC058115]|uniref:hypothetical protein n=1 Tax=Kitasatospora sp. NPDC058115 TaxID=3346347 RepID=UPI0036DC80D7